MPTTVRSVTRRWTLSRGCVSRDCQRSCASSSRDLTTTGRGVSDICKDTSLQYYVDLYFCFVHREMAIKFNDYFEFPREFDMAPYTAAVRSEDDGKPHPALPFPPLCSCS